MTKIKSTHALLIGAIALVVVLRIAAHRAAAVGNAAASPTAGKQPDQWWTFAGTGWATAPMAAA